MFVFIAYIIVFRLWASKPPEYSRVILVKNPKTWFSAYSLIPNLIDYPIRSGLFQTTNDKSPPPPTITNTIVSIFTISYMCILPGVLDKFQLEFFKNWGFWPFYSDFKLKSSENSCKNNIFVILFKIDFKYTKTPKYA